MVYGAWPLFSYLVCLKYFMLVVSTPKSIQAIVGETVILMLPLLLKVKELSSSVEVPNHQEVKFVHS